MLTSILKDLQLEADEEFQNNFRRQAFFDRPWTRRRFSRKPSDKILTDSGALQRSIQSTIIGNSIIYSSDLPYAQIHNNGGTITVTPRMKRYFWAMYYKAAGRRTKLKSGAYSRSKNNQALSDQATFYKTMALKKVGDKITIPQRQYIGDHPQLTQTLQNLIDQLINQHLDHLPP